MQGETGVRHKSGVEVAQTKSMDQVEVADIILAFVDGPG